MPKSNNICHELKRCQLESGDILIRRHKTQRTRLFINLFSPYFTHTAFYYGDGQIIEAIGDELNPNDDIKTSNFLSSDWSTDFLESWVIIRPKIKKEDIFVIKNNLKMIADDPNYTFGLGNKKTSCAELIFNQFIKNGIIIRDKHIPWIVTPDFLFQCAIERTNIFTVIGYNLN